MDAASYYKFVDNFILWLLTPLGLVCLVVVVGFIVFVSIYRMIAKG